MSRPKKDTTQVKRQRAPAKTFEARENQMVALAVDLAEKQLSEGTASSQVITHYLKLGTTRERLEQQKLARENELLKAKTDAIRDQKKVEELYINALNAMQRYSGKSTESDEANEDDD